MRYQQLIITEPVANFRALARQGFQGRWGDAFLKGFLYMLILEVPLLVIFYFTGMLDMPENMTEFMNGSISYEEYMETEYSNMYSNATPFRPFPMTSTSALTPLSWVYSLLIGGALMFGIVSVYIRYRRRQEAPTELLFSGFSNFSRAIALNLIVSIFIALWTLLLIIPGIIAFYRYRLAFYILADNPDIGPIEAINISKAMMDGNKWKLFCLDLSFIGWGLLSGLASVVILIPFSAVMTYSAFYTLNTGALFLFTAITIVIMSLTIGLLYVYNGTAVAAFYERASGLLKYRDEMGTSDHSDRYR
jgi:uncharacterized membrane protein